MQTIIFPLKPGDQNEAVANLHRALFYLLEKLIIKIDNADVDIDQMKLSILEAIDIYDDYTELLISAFQQQEGLHQTGEVDQPTADRLNALLKEQEWFEQQSLFKVSGRVFNSLGEPIAQQYLRIYDVDIRGARIYKTTKEINEIEENNGFQFLGNTFSNIDGYYELSFSSEQYEQADIGLADVIVFAMSNSDHNLIIGRSTLSTKGNYEGSELKNWNVILETSQQRGISEYNRLMKPISALLGQSNLQLLDLIDSSEQIEFLANETEQEVQKVHLLVQAEKLRADAHWDITFHELLYGIGRQYITLDWATLALSSDDTLSNAIKSSIEQNIIWVQQDPELLELIILEFLEVFNKRSTEKLLDTDKNGIGKLLSFSLQEPAMRASFIQEFKNYQGSAEQFWTERLPQVPGFKENPALIQALRVSNELSLLTRNHLPLVEELQVNRKITAPKDLLVFSADDWRRTLNKAEIGWPKDMKEEDKEGYIVGLQQALYTSYPTEKIALMVNRDELVHQDQIIQNGLKSFFEKNTGFHIVTSQITDFKDSIKQLANGKEEALTNQLQSLQRVYQFAPSPDALPKLIELGLTSAYKLASIPEQSFYQMYGEELGKEVARAAHNRASFLATRTQNIVLTLYEYTNGELPAAISGEDEAVETATASLDDSDSGTTSRPEIAAAVKNNRADFETLFGSADTCECQDCRSILSPAAYLVDIMRFLEMSTKNEVGKSPLEVLLSRRPDLQHLPLSCENTNTLIPYIDLVNEIMEYYVAGKMDKAAFDTGDATAEELKAHPQYTEIKAYEKLVDAVYPFNLPYHQPLDVIRQYLAHLQTTRHEVMEVYRDESQPLTEEGKRALASEYLQLSEKDYAIITGKDFKDTSPAKEVWEYYGYTKKEELIAPKVIGPDGKETDPLDARVISELLKSTGIAYTDLVEIIKTKYINPHQPALNFLESTFGGSSIKPDALYSTLKKLNEGAVEPSADVMNVLKQKELTLENFKTWIQNNFEHFGSIVTLYQETGACDLTKTRLKTIKSIYENTTDTAEGDALLPFFSRLHRFIRLWRQLGCVVHDLDNLLYALNEKDIIPNAIQNLANTEKLNKQLKLEWPQLASFWGLIDMYGDKPLYAKLFLNRSFQKIDQAFLPDAFGNYLADAKNKLKKHITAVLAAFKISPSDLALILENEKIDINTASLTIEALSIIYRYALLAKKLNLTVPHLIQAMNLLKAMPFSHWNKDKSAFENADPFKTLEFVENVNAIQKTGFSIPALAYIFNSADAKLSLKEDRILETVKTIRNHFLQIEQEYPEAEAITANEDLLRKKISLIFAPQITEQLLALLSSATTFNSRAFAEKDLLITLPSGVAGKITYDPKEGLVSYSGFLTDGDVAEIEKIKVLDKEGEETKSFHDAVREMYSEQLRTTVNDRIQFSVTLPKSSTVVIPPALNQKISYAPTTGLLQCKGVLLAHEKDTLLRLNEQPEAAKAVNAIYAAPEAFLTENFSALYHGAEKIKEAVAKLLNRPAEDHPFSVQGKWQYFYEAYLPYLKSKLRETIINQQVALLLELDEILASVLIRDKVSELASSINDTGLTGSYYKDDSFKEDQLSFRRTDKAVDFDWNGDSADETIPKGKFGVRWEGWLLSPIKGDFFFTADVKEQDEKVSLFLDEEPVLKKDEGDTKLSNGKGITLAGGQLNKIRVDYANGSNGSGIQLFWKTETSPKEIVPTTSLFPAKVVEDFKQVCLQLHKASLLINGFKLNAEELAYFKQLEAGNPRIDFNRPSFVHWQKLYTYISLRNATPEGALALPQFFRETGKKPGQTVDSLVLLLSAINGWNKTYLKDLADKYKLQVADFGDIGKLIQLKKRIELIESTGASPQLLSEWAQIDSSFEALKKIAQSIKDSLRSRYEEDIWRDTVKDISNNIREHQKQALISYLLVQPELQTWGVVNANSLFEYFLIDVQMDACMDTTRVVQANSSVQLFVTRCLLNLENRLNVEKQQIGVLPNSIDTDRWNWMSQYQVSKANRKMYLYTENWLEPEWRDDKSPFFKELESELLQNDITAETIETAFKNYIYKVAEVANMEVCGMYHDLNTSISHVFARTQAVPYQYYYRTRKNEQWSAWEKVPLDIRGIEDTKNGGKDSGVHLVPVVWKNRTFLFWPEFMEKQADVKLGTGTIKNIAENTKTENLQPEKYWEVKLAWSEYKDGKWHPKQMSKEYVIPSYFSSARVHKFSFKPDLKNYRLSVKFPLEDSLTLGLVYKPNVVGTFNLTDISSGIEIDYVSKSTKKGVLSENFSGYENYYNAEEKSGALVIRSKDFLRIPQDHLITRTNQINTILNPEYDGLLANFGLPFIYKAANRNYFVEHQSDWWGLMGENRDTLTFHNFFHPYINGGDSKNDKYQGFISDLHRGGINKLIVADTTYPDDEGDFFKNTFGPNPDTSLVKDYKDTAALKVNFQETDAYSLYNWEIFFHIPFFLATRLSKNGKYQESRRLFHYVFNPTTNELPVNPAEPSTRYWQVPPFKEAPKESIEEFLRKLKPNMDLSKEDKKIKAWRDNPFKPHLIARGRIIPYMKNVVFKYVENLIAWGDSLFRIDTMESINEATQLYVIAGHILGKRPQVIPKRGKIKIETYNSLKEKLDDFSNAIVQLENLFPYSGKIPESSTTFTGSFLGIGEQFYFCIPQNEYMLKYWDTVEDRLFKVRHCMNIEGVERTLALFAPEIDPGMMAAASAKGISIGSIFKDLNSPAPFYRFNYLVQKALEFCAEVKALGGSLLSVIEKKESEELVRKRTKHEADLLALITAVKERQILEAKAAKGGLLKTRDTAGKRMQHYLDLLGITDKQVPTSPAFPETDAINANSAIPETVFEDIDPDVDVNLVDTDTTGVKLIPMEKEELVQSEDAFNRLKNVALIEQTANLLHLIPDASIDAKFMGIGPGIRYGGMALGTAMSAFSRHYQGLSNAHSYEATKASKMASYIRRDQDWTFQVNMAAGEIVQIDKQIFAAEIRIRIAKKDLENHQKQIENTREVEQFLKDKFTNQELYQWMREQLFQVYKQSYRLAYDMAKRAEKAYSFETGRSDTNFIQYGYWEDIYQGLTAGEKLHLAIKQMEKSFLDDNGRGFELTKHISLVRLNPYALLELKETGSCEVDFPEELFDLDFPGHYFRRIKSVSLTIPCIAGPSTTINCTLRLIKNSIRINSAGTAYRHNNEDGIPTDDSRFVENNIPFKSIATSSAQDDSGVFELNLRDERYLPFEGAGVISKWKLELHGKDKKNNFNFSQFDLSTISDAVFHLKYTANEDVGEFKTEALKNLKEFLEKGINGSDKLFVHLLSLKHDFPTEFYKLLHPSDGLQQASFEVTRNHLPYWLSVQDVKINEENLVLVCIRPKANKLKLINLKINEREVAFNEIKLGNLIRGTVSLSGPLLNKYNIASTTNSLESDEIDDILILINIKVN